MNFDLIYSDNKYFISKMEEKKHGRYVEMYSSEVKGLIYMIIRFIEAGIHGMVKLTDLKLEIFTLKSKLTV